MGHRPLDASGLPAAFLRSLDADEHWTDDDRVCAAAATSFEELADLAAHIAGRMPQPLSAVCGPIRSGGQGDVQSNLEQFAQTIRLLRDDGWNVFNQLPFERHLWRVERLPGKQAVDILNVFYGSLFRKGLITQLAFMPGWRSSFGSAWEHALAVSNSLSIVYLWDQRILRPTP